VGSHTSSQLPLEQSIVHGDCEHWPEQPPLEHAQLPPVQGTVVRGEAPSGSVSGTSGPPFGPVELDPPPHAAMTITPHEAAEQQPRRKRKRIARWYHRR